MPDAQIGTVRAAAAAKPVERQPKPAARAADAGSMVPESVREAVESGVSQARQTYEQARATAEEATEALEEAFAAAMRGAGDFNDRIAAAFKDEACARFELVRDLARAGTPAAAFELQSRFLHTRLDAAQARNAAFAELVSRVAQETAEPVRETLLRTIRALTPKAA